MIQRNHAVDGLRAPAPTRGRGGLPRCAVVFAQDLQFTPAVSKTTASRPGHPARSFQKRLDRSRRPRESRLWCRWPGATGKVESCIASLLRRNLGALPGRSLGPCMDPPRQYRPFGSWPGSNRRSIAPAPLGQGKWRPSRDSPTGQVQTGQSRF